MLLNHWETGLYKCIIIIIIIIIIIVIIVIVIVIIIMIIIIIITIINLLLSLLLLLLLLIWKGFGVFADKPLHGTNSVISFKAANWPQLVKFDFPMY